MALETSVNQKSEAIKSKGPKRNPEIDPLIDQYIKENPQRIAFLKTESKEHLIRRVVVGDAIKHADKAKRLKEETAAIGSFLKKNPEIAEAIEQKIIRVPEQEKQVARIRLGRKAATNTALGI
ncbi:hypothetical protein [Pelagicoccus sp. SDUM812002]|uniref:hypothetical protein n=1 Tax=Pelagicoccus sp. SDUM812002 TaxID=3041266 RepID=UPI00280E2C3E|nr:hypothetical protein [Pelagicoccus sp. SDUM812002]MDQ8184246.1 hypothetical protein [Pelagicoccus sp. SDUM812002]